MAEENTPFYKQEDFLQMLLRAGLSMSSDAGAIAVKEDIEDRETKAKEYTDRALDYVDRMALPKLMQRRAAVAKEQRFAQLLKNTHNMSKEAIKAISNGGVGALEEFYNQAIELKDASGSPLSGGELDSIIPTASQFVDDPQNPVSIRDYINERHSVMKQILKNKKDVPEAAIFSALYADPRTISNQELEEMPMYGEISPMDMVRFAKAGKFEDTTRDEMATYDLEQMDKLTSPSRIERVTPNIAPYVHIALSATDPPDQFNTENTIFKLMLLRRGIDIDNMGKDGSPVQFQGNTRVLDPSTSSDVVNTIVNEYGKLRNEYTSEYLNQPNKTLYTESKAREYLTQFDNFQFNSIPQLKQFLSIIDPAKNKFLKSWDAFKVNNQIVTVKETGYYDEL